MRFRTFLLFLFLFACCGGGLHLRHLSLRGCFPVGLEFVVGVFVHNPRRIGRKPLFQHEIGFLGDESDLVVAKFFNLVDVVEIPSAAGNGRLLAAHAIL